MSGRTPLTDDGREDQLVSLAMDLAQKQMEEGTASSQVVVHYLKAGSKKERLERERLENENAVLRAKVEQMASARRVEELYAQALNAMRTYSGQDPLYDEYDDEEGADYG